MPTPYRFKSVWIMAGLAGALLLALATNLISLPGARDSAHAAQTTTQQNLDAARMAADRQWASATCTNILNWKNEIHRDASSLDLGLGPSTRIRDAVSATTRMLGTLALPPSSRGGEASADAQTLRSEVESGARAIQADAAGLESGNLAAIGRLLADVSRDQALGPQLSNQLRHLITADLGLSLAETRACRALVGIPI
jgi:hypothetical protein